ncbi:MAG: vanadium-dependent haloperoxidase, partial [Blastocatellia bacterium]
MPANEKVRSLLIPIFIIGLAVISRADVVIDWNVIGVNAASAAGKNPIEQSRIYAMTHAAIHDALNAIDRRNKPYALNRRAEPGASPEAAVAAAARDVLVAQLPTQQSNLDAAYATSLSSIADGPAKTNGVAIGQAAAAAILALRSADGSAAPAPYTPGTGPGAYQLTPPDFAPAVLPAWGGVTPFALISGAQFRPARPEFFDLTSAEYADDYTEVKSIGELNSATRTAEQSQIARFWYEGSPNGWNRIARVVSARQELDPWQNARLFGLLNFAMADGFIAGFDAKYHYNFWRPITAIRAGETDDNPATVADPAWTAFLITPASPDYPSTHSILGAAAAEALTRFFGTDTIDFTTTSGAPFPGITRSYRSFSQAAQENADSRVYAGIHYRTACSDGLKMGRKIGLHTFLNSLRPVIYDFDVCLRDDRSGDTLRFSPFTGDYQFIKSGESAPLLIGKAQVKRIGCALALHDPKVSASLTGCPLFGPPRGRALIRLTPLGGVVIINDSNPASHA